MIDEEAKKLFKTLDLNKDGKLEEQEIIIGLKKLKLPSDKVQQFIQEADEDKDGKLSENDFVNWFHQREKYLKQLFDIFDTDHNGHLDEKELKKVLSKLGYHANEKQVHSLLKRLDLDCNGTVEFNEFCAILMLAPLKNPENVVEFWQKVVSIDIGEDFYIPPENKGIRALKYLISGGIAGAVSRTCTAPLDRLKILLQTQSNKKNYSGIIQGLLKIKKEEGILGFWRANGINVLKIFPESGIRFLGYEYYKKLLFNHSETSNLSPYQKLMAGGFAGITSQFIIYPLEVARSRLAISPKNTYKGIIDVFKKMIKKEGPKSLYRGLLPSLLGIMPYAAIDLAIYDMLKTKYIYYQKREPTVTILLSCGAISSFFGQLASYPLDLVRRRLQVQGMMESMGTNSLLVDIPKYNGMIDVLIKTVKYEGFFSLFKGMTPNLLKVVPAVSISYTVYESMKKYMNLT